MSAVLISDIHFNDKPLDEYRWGLFDWLIHSGPAADELIVCGDLTDAKDGHRAKLVNRLCRGFEDLRQKFRRIFILKGNHDYLDPNHPFFEFLGNGVRDIYFVSSPAEWDLSIGSALFVPAGIKWDFSPPNTDYIFTHATFSGAVAENGTKLTGVDPDVLDGYEGKVWSGDIHIPQKLRRGLIEYIGAPYHVRFGDQFDPRVVRLGDNGKSQDLHYPSPRKSSFIIAEPRHLNDERADPGDQVKIRCLLKRSEYDKWPAYRQEIAKIAADRGWVLCGAEPVPLETAAGFRVEDDGRPLALSPDDLLLDYAKQQKLSKEYVAVGTELLNEADRG